MVQRCKGAKVQWCNGAKVQRCKGATVQRCNGTKTCRVNGVADVIILCVDFKIRDFSPLGGNKKGGTNMLVQTMEEMRT